LRIISGKYKRKKIIPPKKLKLRPTTDRAKEGIFNIITNKYDITKISVLDLYSGTGNISYEFSSRGCSKLTAVDINYKSTEFIRKTKDELNMNINIINKNSIYFLKENTKKYDVIFADPPYDYNNYQELIKQILEQDILNNKGIFILEHGGNIKLFDNTIEERKYGNVFFSIFNK
tara:strand:- start:644 stop:1168 length:525 start_codon:yes stop_codon:yes gene_type:complete